MPPDPILSTHSFTPPPDLSLAEGRDNLIRTIFLSPEDITWLLVGVPAVPSATVFVTDRGYTQEVALTAAAALLHEATLLHKPVCPCNICTPLRIARSKAIAVLDATRTSAAMARSATP